MAETEKSWLETEGVPLLMLEGNYNALMQAHAEGDCIPVHGISLMPDKTSPMGVRLIVKMTPEEKQIAKERWGFSTETV